MHWWQPCKSLVIVPSRLHFFKPFLFYFSFSWSVISVVYPITVPKSHPHPPKLLKNSLQEQQIALDTRNAKL